MARTNKQRRDFDELVENVRRIVQTEMREEKGIFSIGAYLASYYMEHCYDSPEHEYITAKKEQLLGIEIASYLASVWGRLKMEKTPNEDGFIEKVTQGFDFKEILLEIDQQLQKLKILLMCAWMDSKFKKLRDDNKNTDNELLKMRNTLFVDYGDYDPERKRKFKIALNLT